MDEEFSLHVKKNQSRTANPSFVLVIVFCLILSVKVFGANPSSPKSQPTDLSSNTNSTGGRATAHTIEQGGAAVIHESWFFYLSSLALTITAGSTLLVALVIVRMQSLSISLTIIERSLAEAFSRIGRWDEYSEKTSKHFLDEQWKDYFDAVGSLAKEHENLFSSPDRFTHFTETNAFVLSLVAQGRRLQERNEKLQFWMKPLFFATAAVAGVAILLLPAALWISQTALLIVWGVFGVVSLILFLFFLRIVNFAFRTL